jgi:hypothetical protein
MLYLGEYRSILPSTEVRAYIRTPVLDLPERIIYSVTIEEEINPRQLPYPPLNSENMDRVGGLIIKSVLDEAYVEQFYAAPVRIHYNTYPDANIKQTVISMEFLPVGSMD